MGLKEATAVGFPDNIYKQFIYIQWSLTVSHSEPSAFVMFPLSCLIISLIKNNNVTVIRSSVQQDSWFDPELW